MATISDYEEKILKRWKIPSLLRTLNLNGVLPMMMCTTFIFFKYRVINKYIVILSFENG